MPAFDAEDMVKVAEMNYKPTPVVSPKEIVQIRDTIIPEISVHDSHKKLASEVIALVRSEETVNQDESVLNGARPYMGAIRIARALALMNNRQSVEQEDIHSALRFVVPHRVQPTFQAMKKERTALDIVNDSIDKKA